MPERVSTSIINQMQRRSSSMFICSNICSEIANIRSERSPSRCDSAIYTADAVDLLFR